MNKKKCSKCGEEKFVEEFHKDKRAKSGFCSACKKCCDEYKKKWRKNNPEKAKESYKKWVKNNLEKNRKYHKEYQQKKRRNDSVFRLNYNIKCAISRSLKGNKNGNHWENLVNFTLEDLKQHLEAQFKDGMTWENYGKWHIDHRIPISLFNIISVKCKGFKKAWELSNLQPLWARENISKNNKLFC